ncbi:hypothetical protein [Pseudomonas sp. KK4]|nr:hypothetical protein [Pseudomonas sp. KK4]
MKNDEPVKPANGTDESVPDVLPSDDEPEADEQQRKIDEIERKVADGN